MALYPPVVASSMPAFDYTSNSVRIYFTLSGYNTSTISQIGSVQLSVRFQTSNTSALKDESQIITISNIQFDYLSNRYYVQLLSDSLTSGFEKDKIYKVQLRFFNSKGTVDIDSYSQWSTVCIIKPIAPPYFYIEQIDPEKSGQDSDEDDENNFYSFFPDFLIIYKQDKSTQFLKSWRVRLLDNAFTREELANIDNYTYADSGQTMVSANNYNMDTNDLVLTCSLAYNMQENQNTQDSGPNYKVYAEIFTKNGYTKSVLYTLVYKPTMINEIENPSLKTYINEQEGYIKIDFSSTEKSVLTNIAIRRSDSKSNFTKWEDLKIFTVTDSINFTYYDFTAESGILYKYLVQKIDSRGRRGTPVQMDSSIMAEWEYAFLIQSGAGTFIPSQQSIDSNLNKVSQLKMKYDFQISSYKTNVSESKTETIGSKYPYIRRNGNMYYRSFPITGTITAYMDEANLFVTDNQIYKNKKNVYQEFRGDIKNYCNVYDYTKERLFREKVQAFLYNIKPKLYKSMQEGNIFVKLMEVSLTPKNELGRLIYTFSATAYQIDEACISVYDKYNLISVGQYNSNLQKTKQVMRQLSSFDPNAPEGGRIFEGNKDIIGAKDPKNASTINLASEIRYKQPFNDQIVNDFTIDWIRIIVESNPYLIINDNGTLRPVEQGDNVQGNINYPLYQIESTYGDQEVYLGHLFFINDEPIIISPPNNIYELKENDLKFNGSNLTIIPAKDTIMSFDYRANLKIIEDDSKNYKNLRVDYINGQLKGKFSNNNQLINNIKVKYRYTYEDQTENTDKIKKYLNSIQSILVDTQPYTVIKLKVSSDNTEYRFVVNETGQLNFDPHDTKVGITSLIIYGKNVPFHEDQVIENNRSSISNPSFGTICKEGNKYYYYLNNIWYSGEIVTNNNYKTMDVLCPVEALLFYYGSVRREYY